jgi:hypothetical protein
VSTQAGGTSDKKSLSRTTKAFPTKLKSLDIFKEVETTSKHGGFVTRECPHLQSSLPNVRLAQTLFLFLQTVAKKLFTVILTEVVVSAVLFKRALVYLCSGKTKSIAMQRSRPRAQAATAPRTAQFAVQDAQSQFAQGDFSAGEVLLSRARASAPGLAATRDPTTVAPAAPRNAPSVDARIPEPLLEAIASSTAPGLTPTPEVVVSVAADTPLLSSPTLEVVAASEAAPLSHLETPAANLAAAATTTPPPPTSLPSVSSTADVRTRIPLRRPPPTEAEVVVAAEAAAEAAIASAAAGCERALVVWEPQKASSGRAAEQNQRPKMSPFWAVATVAAASAAASAAAAVAATALGVAVTATVVAALVDAAALRSSTKPIVNSPPEPQKAALGNGVNQAEYW